MGHHTVPIIVQNPTNLEFYCGESNLPEINIYGLEAGVKLTYEKLFNMRK
jgi:hypothetical protein